MSPGAAGESRAKAVVSARSREQASGQGAIVETGPADKDRRTPRLGDLLNGSRRFPCVSCGRELFGRLCDVDQVMRDSTAGLNRNLVGADVEPPVYGGRVAADNLASDALGQC